MAFFPYRFTNINTQVGGGKIGAPYKYGRASFFTGEQIDTLQAYKKQSLEQLAEEKQVYFGKREWTDILEPLRLISTYASPLFAKVHRGDTALSIAIRLLAFRSAICLLEERIDPFTCSEFGDSPAHLLQQQYHVVMAELAAIERLHYKRQSNMLGDLTDAELARIKKQPYWELKRHEINKVATLLCSRTEEHIRDVTKPAIIKSSRCVLEGITLTKEEQREVDREAFILQMLKISKEVFASTDDSEVPKEFDPAVLEARKRNATATRIQAWFRGTYYRLKVERRRQDKAAYVLQLYFKFVVAWSKHRKTNSRKVHMSHALLSLLNGAPQPSTGVRGILDARRTSLAKIAESSGNVEVS